MKRLSGEKPLHGGPSCESFGPSQTCARGPASADVLPSRSRWLRQGAVGGRLRLPGVAVFLPQHVREDLESCEGSGGPDPLPFAVPLWSLQNGKCLPCVNWLL